MGMTVGRDVQIDRYALLGRAIRALARRGIPLVVMSRAGGFDFEMNGKRAVEGDVLMRASLLDTTLFAALHGDQRGRIRLAA